MSQSSQNYDARILAEIDIFSQQTEVHDLPEIFHYWSDGKVRPKLEAFGFSSPRAMFKLYLERVSAGARMAAHCVLSVSARETATWRSK